MTATLADGARIVAARSHCKGDPEAALDRGAMIVKARDLLKFGGEADPDAIVESVLAMAEGGEVPRFAMEA